MKKGILICAYGDRNWIGGLYYCKSIAYQLSCNLDICKEYSIHIMYDKSNAEHFDGLPNTIHRFEYTHGANGYLDAIQKKYYIIANKISVLFPQGYHERFTKAKSIGWIPDLQDKYYPELFDEDELSNRNSKYISMSKSEIPIVFSSKSAKSDFDKFYPNDRNDCVMHFVSYIYPEIKRMNAARETEILKKYDLIDRKYVCVSNQFWKHKNHIVILKALAYLIKNGCDLYVVFTGSLKDYRNPEYYNELCKYFSIPDYSKHTKIMGFIDRFEQLVIMKHSEFIVQPSLFEGWGTVLEDAKVLDKTVVLSDIPVHTEQKNDKCIMFDPHSHVELANIIEREWGKKHVDDLNKGLDDMLKRAVEYSKPFEELLDRLKD